MPLAAVGFAQRMIFPMVILIKLLFMAMRGKVSGFELAHIGVNVLMLMNLWMFAKIPLHFDINRGVLLTMPN